MSNVMNDENANIISLIALMFIIPFPRKNESQSTDKRRWQGNNRSKRYHGKILVPNFITLCFLSCNSRISSPALLFEEKLLCIHSLFTSIYRRLKPRVFFMPFILLTFSSFRNNGKIKRVIVKVTVHTHTHTSMLENI